MSKRSDSQGPDNELSKREWAVYRQDFTGNEFLVERNLTLTAANDLMAELEAHPHHQHYWVDRLPTCSTDFTAMLAELIAGGSPLRVSIEVLRNQKAGDGDLVLAIQKVCGCSEKEVRGKLR